MPVSTFIPIICEELSPSSSLNKFNNNRNINSFDTLETNKGFIVSEISLSPENKNTKNVLPSTGKNIEEIRQWGSIGVRAGVDEKVSPKTISTFPSSSDFIRESKEKLFNTTHSISEKMVLSTNSMMTSRLSSIKEQEQLVVLDPLPCPVLNSTKTFQRKYFIEMEIITELILAILFGIRGIIIAIVLTFIPRRFRYKDVSGQIILITGSGSGIGKLMAKKFALKHGAIVVAWDINQQGNEDTVKSIKMAGGKCFGYTVDVASKDDIYKAAAKVKKEVGKVDILINNAGIVYGKRLLDTPDENIIKTFQVNSMSNFWTTKAFLPAMLESGRGHIVTVASLAGLFGTNRLVDYCASKFAAVGFDEALKNEIKVELGHSEIHATLVCPYYINTGMFDGVRSKIIPLLSPEPAVNDIVAGILTNQEQIVIPRYVYILIVLRLLVPGEVGRRIASAFGITGAMYSFKGSSSIVQKSVPETLPTINVKSG